MRPGPAGAPLSGSGMFLDATRMVGFGVLKDVTVYPHFFVRHAEKDMLDVVGCHPELLGIGIDEARRLWCTTINLR